MALIALDGVWLRPAIRLDVATLYQKRERRFETMTTEHTATPWRVEPLQWDHGASIAICSTGEDAQIIATIAPENEDEEPDADTARRGPCDEANAAFIVRAVNAHQPLVDALTRLLAETDTNEIFGMDDSENEAILEAQAALKLASEVASTDNAPASVRHGGDVVEASR
jgi:hypothetical protein